MGGAIITIFVIYEMCMNSPKGCGGMGGIGAGKGGEPTREKELLSAQNHPVDCNWNWQGKKRR